MISLRKFATATAFVVTSLTATTAPGSAAVVANLIESGDDLLLSITGSIDLTDAKYYSSGSSNTAFINAKNAFGNRSGGFRMYTAASFSGPANAGPGLGFGSGRSFTTYNNSGDTFLFNWNTGRIGVNSDYTSNSVMSAMATFEGRSFSSIGATEGSYVWTLGNGDTVTLNVGSTDIAPVPLPAGGVLLLTGLAGLALRRKARKA